MLYYCLCLLFLLSCFFNSTSSLSIYLHHSTNPIQHKSTYTTLGRPPDQILEAKVVFLASYNFSDTCRFSQSTNEASLKGKIVVLEGLPRWFKCVFDDRGFPPAVGRVLQEAGAIGVLITSHEKVWLIIFLFSPDIYFLIFFAVSFRESILITIYNSSFSLFRLKADYVMVILAIIIL